MLRALYNGATGLRARQLKVDVTANNLANTNTTGFKKSRAEFSELVSQELKNYGIPAPFEGAGVGSGVSVERISVIFKPGNIIETGRKSDLTISGEGFFRVVRGNDVRYTRNGAFELDMAGNLVLIDGFKLDGIKVEPGTEKIKVDASGMVTSEGTEGVVEAGRIMLYKFADIDGLVAEGGTHFLFSGMGAAESGSPGSEGFGAVRQGFLEAANVDFAEEMANLIEAQRAYGFDARVVRTTEEMWGMANNLRK